MAAEAVPGGCEVPRVGPVGDAVSRAGGIPVGSAGSGGGGGSLSDRELPGGSLSDRELPGGSLSDRLRFA